MAGQNELKYKHHKHGQTWNRYCMYDGVVRGYSILFFIGVALGVRRRGGEEPVLVTVAFGAGETIFQVELLLDARVPKVLDLIVCSSWQVGSNSRPSAL